MQVWDDPTKDLERVIADSRSMQSPSVAQDMKSRLVDCLTRLSTSAFAGSLSASYIGATIALAFSRVRTGSALIADPPDTPRRQAAGPYRAKCRYRDFMLISLDAEGDGWRPIEWPRQPK